MFILCPVCPKGSNLTKYIWVARNEIFSLLVSFGKALTFTCIHLADTFIESDLQMSKNFFTKYTQKYFCAMQCNAPEFSSAYH